MTVNAATTVDLSGVTSGAVVDLRMSANVTSLTLPTTPGSRIDLMLRHLSANTTVTWPAIIRWAASVPPVQTTAGAGGIDWITIRNVGDVWVGFAPALNATA